MLKKLSDVQIKILELLRSSLNQGESLSLREMAALLEVDSANAVLYHIRKLEELDYLVKNKSGKVIRVNTPDEATGGIALLPLLGNARCGQPLDQVVDESTSKMIPVPLRLLNKNLNADLYLIQAIGDSMSPKIEERDYVIFEAKQTPQDGDIVVARTKEGFTIKIFKELKNQYILKPINPKYFPLVFDKRQENKVFNVDGVAIGIFKPQKNLGGGDKK